MRWYGDGPCDANGMGGSCGGGGGGGSSSEPGDVSPSIDKYGGYRLLPNPDAAYRA